MGTLFDEVNEARKYIQDATASLEPDVGIVLGSGLGGFAKQIEEPCVFPYSKIPHMPVSSVIGHAGQFYLGHIGDIPVAVMSGRGHPYEGFSPQACTFGIRLMQALGVKTVLLTNAAGGINPNFAAGDLMVITDHLNLTGQNPLTGPNDDRFGTRFPDMSKAYDPELRSRLLKISWDIRVPLRDGVYAALAGPSYETPAEIRMLRTLGADAVGMSTVLETIAARHGGMRVAGISCITNLAAGLSPTFLSHEEVKATADRVADNFIALLTAAVPVLAADPV